MKQQGRPSSKNNNNNNKLLLSSNQRNKQSVIRFVLFLFVFAFCLNHQWFAKPNDKGKKQQDKIETEGFSLLFLWQKKGKELDYSWPSLCFTSIITIVFTVSCLAVAAGRSEGEGQENSNRPGRHFCEHGQDCFVCYPSYASSSGGLRQYLSQNSILQPSTSTSATTQLDLMIVDYFLLPFTRNSSTSPCYQQQQQQQNNNNKKNKEQKKNNKNNNNNRKEMFSSNWESRRRSLSLTSDDSLPTNSNTNTSRLSPTPPPVLVYHESARSIVFRDHLRRASLSQQQQQLENNNGSMLFDDNENSNNNNSLLSEPVEIMNYQPRIRPLAPLELSSKDQFQPLLRDLPPMDQLTEAEQEVVQLFENQMCCVKTIKNCDWTSFVQRFWKPQKKLHEKYPDIHDDITPHDEYIYNSFVTSTSLLPKLGKKMRSYGSAKEYTTGVVFALPSDYNDDEETEHEAVKRTKTWAWPSGYAAKTEFNIDSYGNLINGRQEALVNFDRLRKNNDDYLTKQDYEICGRMVRGGLSMVPYNEVFLRVGGLGRLVNGKDVMHKQKDDSSSSPERAKRSLEHGVGLPIALFVRNASFGHLISLLRTRARLCFWLGQRNAADLPILFVTPELGVRVLTGEMEKQLLKAVSQSLNPFQNPSIAYKTTIHCKSEEHLIQKREELLDLDSEKIRSTLTPEERARLAGGFGATDESVAMLLMEAMELDKKAAAEARVKGSDNEKTKGDNDDNDNHDHHLQDIVNEGLASAVRSGDYHTARQLLILYSLVASKKSQEEEVDEFETANADSSLKEQVKVAESGSSNNFKDPFCNGIVKQEGSGRASLTSMPPQDTIPPPPPPPPLDTDRLRSATNSDGLLAVLGAAQVLKSMRDGGAKKRVLECVSAIEEWIEHGENSVAFRLASWRDQHAAQADLKIAMEHDSSFMAFVSGKAISNRKSFARRLRVAETNFQEGVYFLKSIHDMVSHMHSPCLRLELLQFILGLDNRFSVAHLARSVELAATCLSITGGGGTNNPTTRASLTL